jgi:hypothetical protein
VEAGGWPGGFARRVRGALAHLHDPVYLQTHPLVCHVAPDRAGGAAPVCAGGALRRALLDAIARLRPPGKAGDAAAPARRHRLLELRYVGALDPPAVQAQLGIEKSQYYREHACALSALVAVLAEDLGVTPAAGAAPGELRPAPARARHEAGLAPARRRLPAGAQTAAFAAGRSLPLEQAIAEALTAGEPGPAATAGPPAPPPGYPPPAERPARAAAPDGRQG